MKKMVRSKDETQWLTKLGGRLDMLIKEKGYSSPYQFWLEAGDTTISRSTLNYILNGRVDVKISTLRKFSVLLDIELHDLLNF